ncbi:hypothetical protein [Arcticibacter sp.]|uniref:hypothetical protein n=1 Tax=Arcticibacter sp. TaxID=1872630 RepID=UPI00388D456B
MKIQTNDIHTVHQSGMPARNGTYEICLPGIAVRQAAKIMTSLSFYDLVSPIKLRRG